MIVACAVLVACDQTSIDELNVRAEPTTSSPVVATIPEVDTGVRITCHTRGEAVRGDTVWYLIESPVRGYVTNYYVRTSGDVLARRPAC